MKPTRHFKIFIALLVAGLIGIGMVFVNRGESHFRPERWGGWSMHHRAHGLTSLCSPNRTNRWEKMEGFVEQFVRLTPEQSQAWKTFMKSLQETDAQIVQICSEHVPALRSGTAPEKLAQIEKLMVVGLGTLREIRPAFNSFYGTLSQEQRRAIDEMASWRHPN